MARMISADIPGVTDPDILFHYRLGVFHAAWSTVDMLVDMAIGRFTGLADQEALMVTWGMMFGPKSKLLASLIKRSGHNRTKDIQTALNALRGAAKRDVLAHGYQLGSDKKIGFLEKPRGGDFAAKMHEFSHEEFRAHVNALIGNANALQDALGYTQEEAQKFVDTAMNLSANA